MQKGFESLSGNGSGRALTNAEMVSTQAGEMSSHQEATTID